MFFELINNPELQPNPLTSKILDREINKSFLLTKIKKNQWESFNLSIHQGCLKTAKPKAIRIQVIQNQKNPKLKLIENAYVWLSHLYKYPTDFISMVNITKQNKTEQNTVKENSTYFIYTESSAVIGKITKYNARINLHLNALNYKKSSIKQNEFLTA